jgi:hypothetical protein
MPKTEHDRSPEELARLGSQAFSRHVRPMLLPEDDGKFAAIDTRTGDYELDEDDYAAVARLRSRHPSADVWLERVGQRTAYLMNAANVEWDGKWRPVLVSPLGNEALIGMRLLRGHDLRSQVAPGGAVEIAPLP